jgi:hypothetical protein
MSNPKTSPRRPDAFTLVCLGLLAVYAVFLGTHATSVAGGSDSSGYLMSARLLTEGRLMLPARTIPELPLAENVWSYTPLGLITTDADTLLRPTYPIGMPLHFAAASTLLGWNWGPIAVGILGGLGVIVLTYACAREFGVDRWLAAVGAASLAFSSILVFSSIQPLSDTLSAAWNTAAFALALRARRDGANWWWSVACGAAVAVAVLVRPTDALLVPALCLVLWNWRRLLGAFVGGVPGALFLGWYNHTLYGSPLTTGYGDIFGSLSSEWLAPSLALYGSWLPRALPAAIVAAGVAWWLPWRTAPRETSALWAWFFAFIGFFAFYPCTHEVWWYLRFILPAFPALVIAATVGCARLPVPAAARTTLIALTALVTLGFGHHTFQRFGVYDMARGQQPYRDLALWARENIPADAAIMTLHASGSLYFYTDFVVIRSDNFGAEKFVAFRERLRTSGRPLYALFFKYDDEPRRQELIPGDWVEVRRVGDFALWRLEQR